ncbi:helix-turn-helix domain-containing protein [Simiduia sp. 21SJ11W-1]
MENWRCQGRGPRYVKVGRYVRYRTSDLLEWLERRTTGGDL